MNTGDLVVIRNVESFDEQLYVGLTGVVVEEPDNLLDILSEKDLEEHLEEPNPGGRFAADDSVWVKLDNPIINPPEKLYPEGYFIAWYREVQLRPPLLLLAKALEGDDV